MKKNIAQFPVHDQEEFKIKMLNWSARFNIFCFLDNNNYSFEQPAFECMLAAGSAKSVILEHASAFNSLKKFSKENPGWLFGHLNYPNIQQEDKAMQDSTGFDDGFFFVPEIVLILTSNHVSIEGDCINVEEVFNLINEQSTNINRVAPAAVDIKNRYTKESYIEIINTLKKHIKRGDCYEINFCQDFYAGNAIIDPLFLYHELTKRSPNPFAAFYKLNDKYCLCASPERFLKRTGNRLISQPIKGTSKRDLTDPAADEENKIYLLKSSKEKSENVMVVDLVRNDLSRISTEGSVQVKELFGIYSFPQVHQMISTIEGIMKSDMHWSDMIRACFPMGSMTGAPKLSVMALIDRYETVPRGLFSGTIGYINPGGDFDFNVIIRSLFYNESRKTISFKAGSGITFYSNATDEYEECMVKASAIMDILANS